MQPKHPPLGHDQALCSLPCPTSLQARVQMALKSVVNSPSTPQPTVSPKPDAYKGIMTITLSSPADNKVLRLLLQGRALHYHQTLQLACPGQCVCGYPTVRM